MYDLVIRGGTVVDGSGAPAFEADVAVLDGKIVGIGSVPDRGAEEIDAKGRIVTPGFVDIHSHYDGQATWDDALAPSSCHGVTSVVMGNCGVGFAPVHPQESARRELIELMEGVEDIPGTALWEGIDWTWESFPEYLDTLDRRSFALDVGALVPHGALRTYVMSGRGSRHEAATAEDIATMAKLAAEGVAAGGMGFSTSRVLGHQSLSGSPVPGTFAAEDELAGIGRAVSAAGGMLQLVPGGSTGSAGIELALKGVKEADLHEEIQWMSRLSRDTGMPISFLLTEAFEYPDAWREALRLTEQEIAKGARLHPQVGGRALGMLLTFGGRTMFDLRPTYRRLADLPFAQRVAELRRPEVRDAILSESNIEPDGAMLNDQLTKSLPKMLSHTYPLGQTPNYEPTPEMSVLAIAAQRGQSPDRVVYDFMLEDDGRGILMVPSLNYAKGNEDALYEMLNHPETVLGLADGGAHCTVTCDGSVPTYMLSHWVKGRQRGPRLSLEQAVRIQTSDTSKMMGFADRGEIALGKRADINVIDFDRLGLLPPRMIQDLPAGGKRLMQLAQGYDATIVAGEIVRREDRDTGRRPGRLIRRGQ